jgi:regulator of protease activity HflC (stomatin/prohibitin superfamily)
MTLRLSAADAGDFPVGEVVARVQGYPGKDNLTPFYREVLIPASDEGTKLYVDPGRVADAIGETNRFLALQKEYEKAPEVTRTRMYLEAMEKILPKLQLYIIDSDKGRVPLHLRMTGP